MSEPWTCGKGLAEHSSLPAKLGELSAAMAEILEIHMRALDRNDENSIQELDAYRKLAEQHRRVAQQLQAIGQEMAGYRDLPMGRHDMEKMSSPEPVAAFAKFVKLEKDLVALLQKRLQQDEKMLGEMSGNP